jgi:hypothetical protein
MSTDVVGDLKTYCNNQPINERIVVEAHEGILQWQQVQQVDTDNYIDRYSLIH